MGISKMMEDIYYGGGDAAMHGNPHYRAAMVAQTDKEAQMQATLAAAWEQRTANLIACSQKVYIRDSPERIRERLGQGVGVPTPPEHAVDLNSEIVVALHRAMSSICFSKPYDKEDSPGDVTEYSVDGVLDLRKVAKEIVTELRLQGAL
jgi:hypothetical protein